MTPYMMSLPNHPDQIKHPFDEFGAGLSKSRQKKP